VYQSPGLKNDMSLCFHLSAFPHLLFLLGRLVFPLIPELFKHYHENTFFSDQECLVQGKDRLTKLGS
jgi:hypothetical protein